MHKLPLIALVEDADLSLEEARHVIDANKAIIGGNWFVYLSDGSLAGGPVNVDGSLDYATMTTIDMPDVFENPDLCRKAKAMLDAADPENIVVQQAALEQLRMAIRLGPQQVIGYDRGGANQKAFEHGHNSAKDHVYAVAKGLGLFNFPEQDGEPQRGLNPAALEDALVFAAGLGGAALEG